MSCCVATFMPLFTIHGLFFLFLPALSQISYNCLQHSTKCKQFIWKNLDSFLCSEVMFSLVLRFYFYYYCWWRRRILPSTIWGNNNVMFGLQKNTEIQKKRAMPENNNICTYKDKHQVSSYVVCVFECCLFWVFACLVHHNNVHINK